MGIWSKAKTVLLGAVIALGGASFLAFGGETPLVADAAEGDIVAQYSDANISSTGYKRWEHIAGNVGDTKFTLSLGQKEYTGINEAANDVGIINEDLSLAQAIDSSAIVGNKGWYFVKTESEINNVAKIDVVVNGISGTKPKVYVASSADGSEWTKIAASGSTLNANSTMTLEFAAIPTAYYGVVFHVESGYTRLNKCVITFYEGASAPMGEITRIEVRTPPTKVDYYVGDTFSLDGLTVYGYDAEGNSKLLDWQGEDSENFVFGIDPGTVLTEEHKTEGAEFVLSYGENFLEPETTWTYSVADAPEAIRYTLLESPSDLVIGSKVLLGVTANDIDYYASSYAESGKTRFDVTSESFMANGGDGLIAFDSTDASVRPLEFEVRIADVTDEDGNKVIALYNAEEEYYVDASKDGTDLSTSSAFSSGVYLTLKDIGGDYGYGLWGNNNENRGITLGTGDPEYFRNYQLTDNKYKDIAAKLYVRSSTGEDQAAELDRYLMEADTEYQCVTKFPVAKDAYLNLMNEEGRTAFASHMDAVTRYEAWATYLGELPYAEGQVQAYMPFAMNQNETWWIIAVAVLASCALLGGGYYFYRKRRSI